MEDYQSHAYNVNAAVEMLQMLRQLMLSAPMEQVEYLMEEKKELGTL